MAKQRKRADRITHAVASGWLIKTDQGYYTGNGHSSLETWTVFPQLAKVYQRQGWAQKMAARLAGQVLPVAVPAHEATAEPTPLFFASHNGVANSKR